MFYNHTGTKVFLPHHFNTKVETIEKIVTPEIIISKLSFDKMWHYVDLADGEISWLGTVNNIGNLYTIEDVFLLKQNVSSAHTDISEEGLAEFGHSILKMENGLEIYKNIKFWGHSHVYMDTRSSYVDDQQMEFFKKCKHPFFIRAILNKRGKIEFSIYFYDKGIKIEDIKWSVENTADKSIRSSIEREYRTKVKTPFVDKPINFVKDIFGNGIEKIIGFNPND